MMQNLGLESGSLLQVRNVTLPKGKFVQLQPHQTKFTELANPRVVLEKVQLQPQQPPAPPLQFPFVRRSQYKLVCVCV